MKFLVDEVDDPLCREVFNKINADESRHLAVGFQVMDTLGGARLRRLLIQTAGSLKPSLVLGLLTSVPLLSRMRTNVLAMGLSEQKLINASTRFVSAGDRSPNTRRLPMYRLFRRHALMMIDGSHPYHRLITPLVWATSHIPRRLLRTPSWSSELTHQPISTGVSAPAPTTTDAATGGAR